MQLCRHLRWKTAARDADDPRWILESIVRSQVPFSCLKTCQAWGPDEELVTPEDCQGGRSCFELELDFDTLPKAKPQIT